jgi:hypothetical protein
MDRLTSMRVSNEASRFLFRENGVAADYFRSLKIENHNSKTNEAKI